MKKSFLLFFFLFLIILGCVKKEPICDSEVITKCYKYEKCRDEQCPIRVDCNEEYDFYVNVTKDLDNCTPLSLRVE